MNVFGNAREPGSPKTLAGTKKTITYCRTSFPEPNDPLAGVSARAASLREYAGQHGMTANGTYMDAEIKRDDAHSAALQQLLADCRAGKIGVCAHNRHRPALTGCRPVVPLLQKFGLYGVHVEFAGMSRFRCHG